MSPTNKLIINFAPTGMIPTKDITPHVPISVNEIIEDVHAAWDAGITMAHIHARDPLTGRPAYQSETYASIIEGIRKFAPELVICVSLSGRDFREFEKRSEVLELDGYLKPDMGSLTLSSFNFNNQASMNEPKMIQDLARRMAERDVVPELEAFDSGMINYARYLTQKGLIEPPYYFNLLLGNIASAQADILQVGIMVRDLPPGSLWSLAGLGNYQLPMNSMAIAVGGGVRVGIEDNIYLDQKRNKLATNLELIQRIHMLAAANEREMMTADEFRSAMNLLPGNGLYGRRQSAA